MKIIIDAQGGDYAPLEVVKGAYLAKKEYNVHIILVGNKVEIEKCCKSENIDINLFEINHCEEVIEMDDDPITLLNEKKGCSMSVAFNLLKEDKGDAIVCAGNTGAILVGGTFIIKRIKGIKRAALAPIIPSFGKYPVMLMDAGANVECRPEMLVQFSKMGSIYMNKVLNISNPKVGLLNIGAEDTKGREFEVNSFNMLKNVTDINFYGNIEARELPSGECNVVVTDGFTGNIALKLIEGMGKNFNTTLKSMFLKNVMGMLSAVLIKGSLNDFKKKMDYKEQGGAILLGVKKPVIKAHGSSDSKAFKNAIRQAINIVNNDVIKDIEESIQV